jgi:hypothetical protein
MGGDPAPLSAEVNQAEQARFLQLETSLNQLKQSDDDADVRRLEDLQVQLQTMAESGGPTANDARRDAASIPEVIQAIHQKQALAANKKAEEEYQQALQRYLRASDMSALQASRSEFQSIASGDGPRAGEAKRFMATEIEPKMAAFRASAEKAAVRAVVQRYVDAFQQRDADAVRKIWPSMSKAEYDGSKQSFSDASAIHMSLSNETIDVAPDRATATVTTEIAQDYTPKGGKLARKNVDHTVFHLVKQNGNWVIMDRK